MNLQYERYRGTAVAFFKVLSRHLVENKPEVHSYQFLSREVVTRP